eukprot:38264-Chlamydomonas_euryale.AAC.1
MDLSGHRHIWPIQAKRSLKDEGKLRSKLQPGVHPGILKACTESVHSGEIVLGVPGVPGVLLKARRWVDPIPKPPTRTLEPPPRTAHLQLTHASP